MTWKFEDKTMEIKYKDENNNFSIDCTNAIWSTDKIHENYQYTAKYGKIGFLCDVDWVIENEASVILVEYKNANIPNANNPSAFRPGEEKKLINVARKYFDSLHWLYLNGKDKPKKFVYVLEYPAGNSTSRNLIRNKLKDKLPFRLQHEISDAGRKLIEEIKVVNIEEWNADPELGVYPIEEIVE